MLQALKTASYAFIQLDAAGDMIYVQGTTVPTATTTGFAKGCIFVDTDVAAGTSGFYLNKGTRTSCDFELAPVTSTTAITSSSATAFAVGLNGSTNPAFLVDSSTGSQAAGLKVVGAATGGTVAIVAIDSGSNTNVTLNAKGSGTIGIGTVSTGAVTITPATTISGAATHSSTTALVGVTTVTAVAGIVSSLATTNQRIVPFFGAGAADTTAAAGAIPLTNYLSMLDSNAGATTQTLAASTIVGQVKKITMVVDGGDDVVTVTSLTGGTTITFSAIGDTVELMWNGSAWIVLAKYNQATASAATPVIG